MTEQEAALRLRILKTAQDQFFSHGFTKVTVDEIANRIGVSKKTIYKFYPSKDELVKAVTETTLKDVEQCCRQIIDDENLGFVDKLQKMMTHAALHISKMGKPLIEDLEKNAPEIWKEISDFRSKRIMEDFGKLLKEGVAKGIFRKDIDRRLILLIYNNVIENVISPEVLTQIPFTASQVYETIIKIFFEGILTGEKPVKYLPKKIVERSFKKGKK
ncbi:MAG: TetR/AcrR family transcriptional regulator [Ignavibacteriales bacterium]|nr:TetR/AcrR family transcriptional regulator [Ignavibacteriales bacterium]